MVISTPATSVTPLMFALTLSFPSIVTFEFGDIVRGYNPRCRHHTRRSRSDRIQAQRSSRVGFGRCSSALSYQQCRRPEDQHGNREPHRLQGVALLPRTSGTSRSHASRNFLGPTGTRSYFLPGRVGAGETPNTRAKPYRSSQTQQRGAVTVARVYRIVGTQKPPGPPRPRPSGAGQRANFPSRLGWEEGDDDGKRATAKGYRTPELGRAAGSHAGSEVPSTSPSEMGRERAGRPPLA